MDVVIHWYKMLQWYEIMPVLYTKYYYVESLAKLKLMTILDSNFVTALLFRGIWENT